MNSYSQEIQKIKTIEELRLYHDKRFIRLAYLTLLGREPDTEGLNQYIVNIRKNISPDNILMELRNSKEGKIYQEYFFMQRGITHLSSHVLNKRILYYYVDHTVICPGNTGIQRVVRCFASMLLERNNENIRFVKWHAQTNQFILINKDELEHLSKWNGPNTNGVEFHCYPDDNSVIPIPLNINSLNNWLIIPEVTHITYQPKLKTLDIITKGKELGLKIAFIFYDATPLKRLELRSMSKEHACYMKSLLLADLIVPISNYSSNDLVSFFKFSEQATSILPPIHSIPLPGKSQISNRITTSKVKLKNNPTIISVGTITPHKNQLTLIHAFNIYCQKNSNTNWRLKLIGHISPEIQDELFELQHLNPYIECLGNVSEEKLEILYKDCVFTVFPSVTEGYGLPILESLWYAKPCICANFGAMAEVAVDGGCLTVDTYDEQELFSAISLLIENPDKINQLSKEAINRPIDDWRHYTTKFLHCLDEVSNPLKSLGHIYYWVDHTSTYPANSGIQRVVRGLARSLLEQGIRLIATKWDEDLQHFYPASSEDLQHLEKWNGPIATQWSKWLDPVNSATCDWLLIPELTHYLTKTSVKDISNYTKEISLRCAWIFHDAIPWKMPELYPPEATARHRQYMLELNCFEKVFPTCEFTKIDLMNFLTAQKIKVGNIEDRVVSCTLPGEFKGSNRLTHLKEKTSEKIRIFCVGTVEPRKNHLGLVSAFLDAQKRSIIPMELIIAGGSPFNDLAIQLQQLINETTNIKWERRVNDDFLLKLYTDCDFTVFPSIEEGFGIPILESLWNARPCICANFGAMAEVAQGGGCLTVDVRNSSLLAKAILKLVENEPLRKKLSSEVMSRSFKTWHDYGYEIALELARERHISVESQLTSSCTNIIEFQNEFVNINKKPLLSICISTYNRADWLALSLKNLERLLITPCEDIEIVICDNTSTDSTPEIVKPYLNREDFHYYRNEHNVGMLGNLRVTAHHAQGDYVWILGDDDLINPNSIEYIVQIIRENPNIALIYLNYAYTRQEDASKVTDLDLFLKDSTPILEPTEDLVAPIYTICSQSENFFTAIYCLVFRRDHALRAYSQNTSGRPFSTMLTCIPTTYYVLNYMTDELGYWVGRPQLVVNLNVSWMKYAPLWILERVPEFHDIAEKLGANPILVDRWRINNIPGVLHFFKQIFKNDLEGNSEFISIFRLINRLKHLDEFKIIIPELRECYKSAHINNHPLARLPVTDIFSAFE